MNPLDRLKALKQDNDLHIAHMAAHEERFNKIRNRHSNGTAPRAVSSFNLFQTPKTIAEVMANLLEIEEGMTILEPSAGLGRLIDPCLSRGARVIAVEQNTDLCRELYGKYEDMKIIQRDFLEVEPFQVDGVIMNPPFHMRSDIEHIKHAMKFSSNIVGICMAGRFREEALRDLCSVWELLPAGTFEGTKVETIMFKI